ncbi:MAG: SPOR domain-containing protein [Candidatus Omnitrophota bacterium]
MYNKTPAKQLEFLVDGIGAATQKEESGASDNKGRTFYPRKVIFYCISLILLFTFVYGLGIKKGRMMMLRELVQKKTALTLPINKVVDIKSATTRIATPDLKKGLPQSQPVKIAPYKVGVVKFNQQPVFKYTIQVATYRGKISAQKELSILKQSGFDAFLIHGENFIKICVGRFFEKEKAQLLLSQLKKKYKDCFMRRI